MGRPAHALSPQEEIPRNTIEAISEFSRLLQNYPNEFFRTNAPKALEFIKERAFKTHPDQSPSKRNLMDVLRTTEEKVVKLISQINEFAKSHGLSFRVKANTGGIGSEVIYEIIPHTWKQDTNTSKPITIISITKQEKAAIEKALKQNIQKINTSSVRRVLELLQEQIETGAITADIERIATDMQTEQVVSQIMSSIREALRKKIPELWIQTVKAGIGDGGHGNQKIIYRYHLRHEKFAKPEKKK